MYYIGHTIIHLIHINHTELSESNHDPSSQPLPQPRIVVGLVSGKCYIKEARTLPDGRASHCLLLAYETEPSMLMGCLEMMPCDDGLLLACSLKCIFLVVVPRSCMARKLPNRCGDIRTQVNAINSVTRFRRAWRLVCCLS